MNNRLDGISYRMKVGLLACLGVMLVGSFIAVSSAKALLSDPFTPEFLVPGEPMEPFIIGDGVIPGVNPNSTAGAITDLIVEMQKPENVCPDSDGNGVPDRFCDIEDFYMEQDTKKMAVNFPPGFLPDPNAAPYCEPELRWRWTAHLNHDFDERMEEAHVWSCDPKSAIATVRLDVGQCVRYWDWGIAGCNTMFDRVLLFRGFKGAVYNARPKPGEQGRLIVLVPDWPFGQSIPGGGEDEFPWIRTDIGIRVRDGDDGDFGFEAVADMIPTEVNVPRRKKQDDGSYEDQKPYRIPTQLPRIKLGLYGSTGAGKGHPLLTNPTSCEQKSFNALLQGYERNSDEPPSNWTDDTNNPIIFPASGEGSAVTDSVPYQVTNCEAVPYAPTFTASTDSEAPGAAAALSTVITQKDFEATTKKVQVEFPKGMGVNINSSLKSCSAADLTAKSCPEVSKMGTVEAESRLLPKREFVGNSVKKEDEVMRGNAYLTGIKGNKLTLSLLLEGFVDVRIDGTAGVDANGILTATFDDVPPVPLNKFTLNLFGGEKGLLTNSRKCGTNTTKATFTSHSGKTHTVQSTSQIKGCDKPSFDVELSERGKGKRTSVELDVATQGRSIKSLRFGLPRYLKWTTKKLGKRKKFGTISFNTAGKQQATQLRLGQNLLKKRKKKKALKFGTLGALSNLKVSLYKKKVGTKKVKVRTKSGKKKTRKKAVLKSRLSLKPLPKKLDRVTVELNPSESRFMRNPKGCKNPLKFLAFVTTDDGKRHVLSQKIKLKGKGCSKKKKSKKK